MRVRVLAGLLMVLGIIALISPHFSPWLIFYHSLPINHNDTIFSVRDVSSHNWSSAAVIPPNKLIQYEVSLLLTYPKKTRVGDSFTIRAQPQITNVQQLSFGYNPSYETDPSAQEVFVKGSRGLSDAAKQEYLRKADISFNLECPGMEFTETASSQADEPLIWTVRPKSSGHFIGTIKPVDRYEFVLHDSTTHKPPTIEIEVTNNWFDRDSIRAGVVYIMGSLLTVPGAFAFLRDFRRSRNRRGKNR